MSKRNQRQMQQGVRPLQLSPAVRGALQRYYEDVAISGVPLIPLDQCRITLKMSVLVVDHAIRYMTFKNPFGMSSLGKQG